MLKISNIEIKAEESSIDVLSTLLEDRVRSVLEATGSDDGERVVQVSVKIPCVDPLQWLAQQNATERNYWKARDANFQSAGTGAAVRVSGDDDFFSSEGRKRISDLLSESEEEVRIYGGLRFNPDADRGLEWMNFKSYNFVLPRYELRTGFNSSQFIVNLVLPVDKNDGEDIVSGIQKPLCAAFEAGSESVDNSVDGLKATSRLDLPTPTGWNQNVEWSLSAFSRSRLGKVVLARKAVFDLDQAPDPAALLLRLKNETPNCFHFLFQAGSSEAFVGASPERLIKVQDRRVASEAVAGTRPRGTDEQDDESLRDELLHSEKDQREHQFVRTSIKDTLSTYCDVLHVDNEASEMMLNRGRHLVSHIEGVLQRGADIIDVVRDLHPTSAVGGYPTRDAMEVIEGLEPFDRGWYAGPIGWISRSRTEFAVAIRSGLVGEKKLTLYSGAGIVGGSEPSTEWNEIEQKIDDFVQVFGLNPSSA